MYQLASLYVVDDQLHIIIASQVCALAKSDLHFGRCIAMGIQKVSKFMIKTSQNSIAIKFLIATYIYDQLLIKALHKTIAVYIYIVASYVATYFLSSHSVALYQQWEKRWFLIQLIGNLTIYTFCAIRGAWWRLVYYYMND